jgi:hypothetical protein
LQALPDLSQAATLAPDYVARAHAAERAAAAADTAAARTAQHLRAEWLAQAALAEADRIALMRSVDAYEARIEVAQTARAQAERAGLERDRQRVRDSAAALEHSEAAWVFTQLARGPEKADKTARDRAWEFLLRRSVGTLAAAGALGAEAAVVERANLQLTAARSSALVLRIEAGEAALRAANAALGSARAHAPHATAAERADLIARLHERGFVAVAAAQGAVVVEVAEVGGSRTPPLSTADRRRRLAWLADLLPAFPHGPLVLTCGRKVAKDCDAPNWLAPVERARLQRGAQPTDLERPADASAALQLVLPAYTLASP